MVYVYHIKDDKDEVIEHVEETASPLKKGK